MKGGGLALVMLLIRYASGGELPMRDAMGGALPMRDVALIRYVWGSRIGANERRMGTNGIGDVMRMMTTRDFEPDSCGMATCRARSLYRAAPVAHAAA